MKQSVIILILAIVYLSGCKSNTEPQGNKLGPSITVTSNWSPSLDGGGRWFNGADTGTWYDAKLSYTLDNSLSSPKDISYRLEIGVFKNGMFQSGGGELFYDGDSVFSGSHTIRGSTTLDLTQLIGVGRKNRKDWSYAYGYRLTLTDITTKDLYVTEGPFSGSDPENRFHGVVYTTEQSPDPLGVLDAPDDSDWSHNAKDGVFPLSIYPNPVMKFASFTWIVQEQGAIAAFSLNRTPRDSVFSLATPLLQAGQHTYSISFDNVRTGMYRLYFSGKIGGEVFTSHGDVIVLK